MTPIQKAVQKFHEIVNNDYQEPIYKFIEIKNLLWKTKNIHTSTMFDENIEPFDGDECLTFRSERSSLYQLLKNYLINNNIHYFVFKNKVGNMISFTFFIKRNTMN